MKAQPLKYEEIDGEGIYSFCDSSAATHVQLRLPGPISNIRLPVLVGMSKTREGTGCWSWNGDIEKPTIKPSILNDFRPHGSLVNHVWITDGMVQFLGDCTHELAGQTLDLLEAKYKR